MVPRPCAGLSGVRAPQARRLGARSPAVRGEPAGGRAGRRQAGQALGPPRTRLPRRLRGRLPQGRAAAQAGAGAGRGAARGLPEGRGASRSRAGRARTRALRRCPRAARRVGPPDAPLRPAGSSGDRAVPARAGRLRRGGLGRGRGIARARTAARSRRGGLCLARPRLVRKGRARHLPAEISTAPRWPPRRDSISPARAASGG